MRTFGLQGRTDPMRFFGPKGAKRILGAAMTMGMERPVFEFEITEVAPGETLDRGDYELKTYAAEHGGNALGWVLAGAVGAVIGPLIAPSTTLSTGMFFTFIIYACAAATLGGFDSPIGAVIAGLVIGVTENLIASYVGFIGDSLKLAVALVILLVVLMVRPSGLFGSREVERV